MPYDTSFNFGANATRKPAKLRKPAARPKSPKVDAAPRAHRYRSGPGIWSQAGGGS